MEDEKRGEGGGGPTATTKGLRERRKAGLMAPLPPLQHQHQHQHRRQRTPSSVLEHLVVALPAARASTRLLVLGAVSLGTYLWVVTVVRGLRWALRAKRICVWVLSRFLPVKGYDKTHEIMRVDATMTNFKGRDPTESTATKPRVSVTTATTTTATSSPLHHLLDKSTAAAAATAKLRCAVVAANNAKLDDVSVLDDDDDDCLLMDSQHQRAGDLNKKNKKNKPLQEDDDGKAKNNDQQLPHQQNNNNNNNQQHHELVVTIAEE